MPKNPRNKNKQDSCRYCNNLFNHYNWDSQVFCSRKCRADYLKSLRPILNCNVCNKLITITKYRETRNNEYYCSRECYNNRRKEDLKRLKRGTKYYIDLIARSNCECGVYEDYLLQIHHKDGNHNNNDPSNLQIVCANCHIKRHLKVNKNGKLVYHPKSLTDLKLLKALEDA